jgi:hypothetical protein
MKKSVPDPPAVVLADSVSPGISYSERAFKNHGGGQTFGRSTFTNRRLKEERAVTALLQVSVFWFEALESPDADFAGSSERDTDPAPE